MVDKCDCTSTAVRGAFESRSAVTRLYTQNIDGLDYQCDVPADKLVAVHGSIGRGAASLRIVATT